MNNYRPTPQELFAAIDNSRYDELPRIVSDDVKFRTPMGHIEGLAGWIEFSKGFARACPDGRHTVTRFIEHDDWGTVQGVYNATQTGPLATPQGEIPATGRSLTLEFLALGHRATDGRLDSVEVYFDRTAMAEQLGLVPEPAVA